MGAVEEPTPAEEGGTPRNQNYLRDSSASVNNRGPIIKHPRGHRTHREVSLLECFICRQGCITMNNRGEWTLKQESFGHFSNCAIS